MEVIVSVILFILLTASSFLLGWLYAVTALINEEAYISLSEERSLIKMVCRLFGMIKAQWRIVEYRNHRRY